MVVPVRISTIRNQQLYSLEMSEIVQQVKAIIAFVGAG
jgi:hypothetical protein